MTSELLKNIGFILDNAPDCVVVEAAKQVLNYVVSKRYGYRHEYMRLVALYLNHMDRGGNYDADTLLARMSEDWLKFDSDTLVTDDESFWLPEDKVSNGPTLFDSMEL